MSGSLPLRREYENSQFHSVLRICCPSSDIERVVVADDQRVRQFHSVLRIVTTLLAHLSRRFVAPPVMEEQVRVLEGR